MLPLNPLLSEFTATSICVSPGSVMATVLQPRVFPSKSGQPPFFHAKSPAVPS
jgi:hypothetical protein